MLKKNCQKSETCFICRYFYFSHIVVVPFFLPSKTIYQLKLVQLTILKVINSYSLERQRRLHHIDSTDMKKNCCNFSEFFKIKFGHFYMTTFISCHVMSKSITKKLVHANAVKVYKVLDIHVRNIEVISERFFIRNAGRLVSKLGFWLEIFCLVFFDILTKENSQTVFGCMSLERLIVEVECQTVSYLTMTNKSNRRFLILQVPKIKLLSRKQQRRPFSNLLTTLVKFVLLLQSIYSIRTNKINRKQK